VLVTFDDGYRSVHRRALPLLARLSIPAVLVVSSDAIEERRLFWWDAVARARGEAAVEPLKEVPAAALRDALPETSPLADDDPLAPMTAAEVGELAAAPGIEIGNHTASHPILARADAAGQRAELARAADRIRAWAGRPPRSFAYPNGRRQDYTAETVALVREAGHDFGFTTVPGFARPGEAPLERSRFLLLAGTSAAELAHRLSYSWRT
jgi:peptidoglycan/xylan/chitin deacetylase (PgdA/CDA1 family)